MIGIDLSGRVALVTGGSRGIGRATVLRLAAADRLFTIVADRFGRLDIAVANAGIWPPDDVAGPILFLCSNLARHITGEVLNVNGGSVLCG